MPNEKLPNEKSIYNLTVKRMKSLGTYRKEFEAPIKRYASLSVSYEIMSNEWIENGRIIVEEYTNNSGATNMRKTALYLALETLRKELLELEKEFGLTSSAMKKIKSTGLDEKKESALDKVLMSLEA